MRTASISINHHRATLKLSRSSEIKKRELAVTPIEFFETVTKIESQSIEINPDEEKKKKKLEREYVKNLLKGNTGFLFVNLPYFHCLNINFNKRKTS